MARNSIAIISVLKPNTDPRSFHKIGVSIGQTNKYEINIIGFGVKKIEKLENINLYGLGTFNRISLKRLCIPWIMMRLLLKQKHEVIICNTHELLAVSILNKIIFGSKIIYDLQENYYRNIKYGPGFPSIIKFPLASFVRLKEILFHPFIDHYFVAEQAYVTEMPYIKHKCTLLENKCLQYTTKYRKNPKLKFPSKGIHFVYSGTVAENYGIYDALKFMDVYHTTNPNAYMTIIGHCPHEPTMKTLLSPINRKDYIILNISTIPIKYELILEVLSNGDFAIMPYRISPEITGSIPTKIYECMALHIPMILPKHPPWEALCKPLASAIFCDFDSPVKVVQQLTVTNSFYNVEPPSSIFWESQEPELLLLIERLMPK